MPAEVLTHQNTHPAANQLFSALSFPCGLGKLRHWKAEGGTRLSSEKGKVRVFSNCTSSKASHVSLPVLLLTRRKTHPVQIALK